MSPNLLHVLVPLDVAPSPADYTPLVIILLLAVVAVVAALLIIRLVRGGRK